MIAQFINPYVLNLIHATPLRTTIVIVSYLICFQACYVAWYMNASIRDKLLHLNDLWSRTLIE